MKLYMKLFIAYTGLLFVAISCHDTKFKAPAPNNECFEVSYVTGICGQAMLKIENPAFFRFGETWDGHSNVFYTVFDCSVEEIKLKQARFFVTISQNNSDSYSNCVRCMAALDYQGSKKYFVSIVTECNVSLVE